MEYPVPLGGGYENIRYVYVFSNGKLDRDPRSGLAKVINIHTLHRKYHHCGILLDAWWPPSTIYLVCIFSTTKF